jgi:hypothetical protein
VTGAQVGRAILGQPWRSIIRRTYPLYPQGILFSRKPGHWRAAFVRKALTGTAVRGDTVHSSVTPDDFASEAEAQFAAEKIIRKM